MLKNKIYNYFFSEILKNFLTILLTFTAIAWVVRAVNFLDLLVDDGFTSGVYLKYAILNLTTIITRFIPLAFLLSLTISIVKFERQQELLILWTTGLGKIKVANIFLVIGLFVTIFHLVLSIFVNPFLLNNSRALLNNTEQLQINSVLKSSDFSDAFKGITFYIDKKNNDNELTNIFIQDTNGSLKVLTNKSTSLKQSVIIAKKGFVNNNKLILFDGVIQTINKKNEIKNIEFTKNELSLANISTRIITKPKIQETSSILLLKCIFDKSNNLNLTNCSKNDYNENVIQNLSRRIGSPLYIPLITIIICFLLLSKKESKYNFLNKYALFLISFIMLIISEIFLKYTGISFLAGISYYILPVIMSLLLYLYLMTKMKNEKI